MPTEIPIQALIEGYQRENTNVLQRALIAETAQNVLEAQLDELRRDRDLGVVRAEQAERERDALVAEVTYLREQATKAVAPEVEHESSDSSIDAN